MTGGSAGPQRPPAVAITGGIGAGKSEALKAFARHGAAVISSDEIVHRLLREEADVRRALVERWGDRVVGPDGLVSRPRVAEIVFADRAELEWLEALLHPLVAAEYLGWRERQRAPLTVTEVPLLYESGGDERFDAVVVVTAPEDLRATRARVPLTARSRRLIPDEEKVRRADYAYVNDGSLEELDAWVAGVVRELTG